MDYVTTLGAHDEIVYRLNDMWQNEWDIVDPVVADDYTNHNPIVPDAPPGPAEFKQNVSALLAGVEDGDGDPFATSFTHDNDDNLRHYDATVSALEVGGQVRGYGLVVRETTENHMHVRDLEQQTERLKRFASRLSHDIRNPLNVAEGRGQLARETGDINHLETASLAHDRISQIIEDVLELTREGRRIDDPEHVRVSEVLQAAWETTERGGRDSRNRRQDSA